MAYELERLSHSHNRAVRFSRAAYTRFMEFAVADEALWLGNFRELAASLERMTTFTLAGDIELETVEEIAVLRQGWAALDEGPASPPSGAVSAGCHDDERLRAVLGDEAFARLDLFERFYLAGTVRVCRESATLSAAGRTLFAVSRTGKRHHDDASRLYNYLKKYNLDWRTVKG